MNLRLALYDVMDRYRLDAASAERLEALAGWRREPAAVRELLPRIVAVLGAALTGLGLVMWVAANWSAWGRLAHFALLQGALAVLCVAVVARPAWRVPLGLPAVLSIGALLAYFGQTYQSGADAWQLFALWALLALPLCWSVRADVVWTAWVLVAMTGLSLWVHAHAGHRWAGQGRDVPAQLLAWALAAALTAALGPRLRARTGAGLWTVRTALSLAVLMVVATSLAGLMWTRLSSVYPVGLLALAGAAVLRGRPGDVFGLSLCLLGLNVLLIAGLADALLRDGGRGDALGRLMVIGVAAATLLAASVSRVMKVARRHEGLRGEA